MPRLHWPPIIARAAQIVDGYTTPVSLRQLHYRLVAAGLIPNTKSAYTGLSRRTAKARREGRFPALVDDTRSVEAPQSFASPADAIDRVADAYRLDRTDGQDRQIWMILEKATVLAQVTAWTHHLGLPVVALRGYTSTPLIAEVNARLATDDRESLAFYLGDHDPSGHNIEQVFFSRCHFDTKPRRLAVEPGQIDTLGLIANYGKEKDPRAAAFKAKHGELVQVEVEAIDPAVLEAIVVDAVTAEVDYDALDRVIAREEAGRRRLLELADAEAATSTPEQD